ncbi:MAG: hypothetical protein FWE72_02900 [Spirochaetaceae bacterium]|nr:hypothetical protein [Spirochaetaceae bacterium]
MKKIKKKVILKLCKISIPIIIFSFLLSIPLYSDANNEIAKLYLTAADSFFKEDKFDETEMFLNKAALYNQELSDIYYIKALIVIKLNEDLNNSINYLKKAITYRNWNLYNENNAFYELGQLYTRVKDYERALSALYVIKDQYIDDPGFIDLYTLSLINRGDFAGAQDYLSYAVSKYPDNNVFIKRLLGIDKAYRDNLLKVILDNNDLYKYAPEIILELSRLTPDKGVKRELILLAEKAGNNSIELLLERIAVAGKTTINDIVIFSTLKGFSDYKNIKIINSMIPDKEVSAFLKEYYDAYSGLIRDDINSDGIFEKIMSVEKGIPQWYSEDKNQDNVNDFFVGFQNGKPAFINIEENMLIAYYEYPFVKTVILYNKHSSEIYNFKNNRTHFDILDYSNYLIPPLFKNTNISELFNSIKKSADNSRKSDIDSLKVLFEYFKTENIVNFQSYDQINSIVRRGTRRDNNITYRESDLNQDNIFETREIYRDGVLYEIKYDGNNNGIFEFKIENGVKYWDFDEDGIYDAREWDEGGITYREFATNMDGVFNFTAKYENKILVEVKKNDKWNKVYYDKKNNIYWIGEKRINIDSAINLESGKYIYSGNNTAYIIKVGSDYFAEVIN